MSDWTEATLGEVGDALIGLTYRPDQVSSSGTLVLRSSNIQGGRLDLSDLVRVTTKIPNRIRVQKSDILICVRNGSRRLIGKSLYLDDRVANETFGAFMTVYRSTLNSYLRYFFESDEFKKQVDEHLGATINQITNGSLRGFSVRYPGECERKEIADRLADADALAESLERLIAKKGEVKRGMMQELLTGGTRLPGFDGNWTGVRLGDVLAVRHGRDQKSIEVADGRYKILATGGQIGSTNTALYSKRSVLIGRKGTIDRPQFQDEPFWSVDTLFYTEIGDSADPKYLFYMFQTIDWRSMNEASGVPSLTSGRVESVEVDLPTIEEQCAIRAVLDDAESEIIALEHRLESARAVRVGMMQELLTGRTRLPMKEDA